MGVGITAGGRGPLLAYGGQKPISEFLSIWGFAYAPVGLLADGVAAHDRVGGCDSRVVGDREHMIAGSRWRQDATITGACTSCTQHNTRSVVARTSVFGGDSGGLNSAGLPKGRFS